MSKKITLSEAREQDFSTEQIETLSELGSIDKRSLRSTSAATPTVRSDQDLIFGAGAARTNSAKYKVLREFNWGEVRAELTKSHDSGKVTLTVFLPNRRPVRFPPSYSRTALAVFLCGKEEGMEAFRTSAGSV